MERRKFGKTDMEVSVLGFGGAEIGSNTPLETVDRLLGSALDAGLNIIDTAACYGDSEELIGKAVGHRRDDYFLFTKCGHASGLEFQDWDPDLIEQSVDRSLKRLQTDYLDVVHLHSCSEEMLRNGELIEELLRMKEKGKTRYIGYSGDSQAAKYAVQTGIIDSFETSISVADQEAIDLTIPDAVQRGIGVIAKRPIANVAWQYDTLPDKPYIHDYWKRLQQLNYDFLQGDLTNGVERALKFTLSVPGVHTAIVGTKKPSRWIENAKLLENGSLTNEEYESIRGTWKQTANTDWIGLT